MPWEILMLKLNQCPFLLFLFSLNCVWDIQCISLCGSMDTLSILGLSQIGSGVHIIFLTCFSWIWNGCIWKSQNICFTIGRLASFFLQAISRNIYSVNSYLSQPGNFFRWLFIFLGFYLLIGYCRYSTDLAKQLTASLHNVLTSCGSVRISFSRRTPEKVSKNLVSSFYLTIVHA